MTVVRTTRIFKRVDAAIKKGYTIVSAQGSSRSSKTYNILIWLIHYLLTHAGLRLSIVRAGLPSIKGSVYIDFLEILKAFDIYDPSALNKSELTYTLPNGSWVEFFSTDSEQKLRGRKRDILFVNEANEIGYLEWQQLQLRTTMFSIIDYNPSFSDDHWICEVNQDERTYHFISTYKDNPFLESKIVAEIESLRTRNPSLWQIYGLGLQAAVEGLIFKQVEQIGEMPEFTQKGRAFLGMDFGFTNDPTAIVRVIVEEATKTLYLDELCYRTEMLTSDIIHALKPWKGLKVISESADPRLVEEIYRAGVNIHPVKKYAGSVEAGLAKMQEYRLCVTKRSTNIIKELRNYTYSRDKEGKWLNTPIDLWNHAIDAVRYVVMSEVMGGRAKRVNLSRIAAAINR